MDYSYSVSSGIAAGSIFATIFAWVLTIVCIVGLWLVFKKAGEPGWASIVPFYNFYELFKISLGDGWKMLWLLVPFANVVFMLMAYVKLAERFGKSAGFGIGMIFLTPIFMLILGLDDSEYQPFED